MTEVRRSYPFSAVVGQEEFKLALLLVAVNPAIGGVLISGPRGCAKSTLARAMAELLPCGGEAFATLPLGASSDMVTGSLDLQQVLDDKSVAFQPGLLAKAHEGVLYVDEVNLLHDSLVDLLLDVAASGVNRVERDGISHSHDANFVLVGTMNPDEGELRPQLQDRFGLAVNLSNRFSVEERVEIVQQREAFDLDNEAFCDSYHDQQQDLIARIAKAKEALTGVTCDVQWRADIARRCAAANVEGLRADLVWLRAAQAYAALNGQNVVDQAAIDAVEALVLNHRRHPDVPASQPNSDNGQGSNNPPATGSNGGFKRPPESRGPQGKAESQGGGAQGGNGGGDWGAMDSAQLKGLSEVEGTTLDPKFCEALGQLRQRLELPATPIKPLLEGLQPQPKGAALTPDGRVSASVNAGSHASNVHWPSTLRGTMAQGSSDWPPAELAFRAPELAEKVLHLVLLDTSASGLSGSSGLLPAAKEAVLSIGRQAYLAREEMAVWGFGNEATQTLLSKIRAPKHLQHHLDRAQVGGGTPLRMALEKAGEQWLRLQRQQPELRLIAYIISDGRTTQNVDGLALAGQCVFIDTETDVPKRGRGPVLAEQLNAAYLPLSSFLTE